MHLLFDQYRSTQSAHETALGTSKPFMSDVCFYVGILMPESFYTIPPLGLAALLGGQKLAP
jgi:hypothetical protein